MLSLGAQYFSYLIISVFFNIISKSCIQVIQIPDIESFYRFIINMSQKCCTFADEKSISY